MPVGRIKRTNKQTNKINGNKGGGGGDEKEYGVIWQIKGRAYVECWRGLEG